MVEFGKEEVEAVAAIELHSVRWDLEDLYEGSQHVQCRLRSMMAFVVSKCYEILHQWELFLFHMHI